MIELEEAHTRPICGNNTMYLIHILLMLITLVVNRFILCCENYSRSSKIFGENHVAALILARGGSKGIKLKNISKLGNSTLLEISLNEMDKLTGVDSIWVSTDHELILKKIENRNVNVHWRSAESATDEASSLTAVQEFLRHHRQVDVVGLVQCTSPFVRSSYLQDGLDAVIRRGRDCSFSASRSYKLRWKKDGDRLFPVNFDPSKRPRRQDFEYDFVENGMFYFATRTLIQKGYFQSDK